MAFGLSTTGSTTATTLIFVKSHESNILGHLFLKVKKLLTLTGDVKMIFKLLYINLSLNDF